MSAINFGSQYRGIKDCQGMVFSGPTAASTYQTQFHAPLQAEYAFLPNGRIVYQNDLGEFTPICPINNTTTKFAMPLLLSEGGGKISQVPQTWPDPKNSAITEELAAVRSGAQKTPSRYGQEAPYRSAIPQPHPNVMALPLCTGYEFMTTEYVDDAYIPNQALTSIADSGNAASLAVGMVLPLTTDQEVCIGLVSRKPGIGRQYGDPMNNLVNFIDSDGIVTPNPAYASGPGVPNPMVAVTGKNKPGLTFWGCPLPAGATIVT